MAFDWRQYLLFAHELRSETSEVKQRTSIGRAYYYIYNSAVIEARKLGFNEHDRALKGGIHKKLWDWCLKQTTNKDIVALGDAGNTLKARRVTADYNQFYSGNLPHDVQKQLDEARDLELLLARIKRSSPPPALL